MQPTISSCIQPQPYHHSLTPRPSTLRPHCLAKERLIRWIPSAQPSHTASTQDRTSLVAPLSDAQLNRILFVMGASLAESTKATYGSGLLIFHVYCDLLDIPDERRCPISSQLLLTFLSSCAGAYSGSTLANYAAALRAWHILHSANWDINPNQLKTILEGAARLAPMSSKREPRKPYEPDIILQFRSHLNLNDPLDATVFACLTTVFFCVARLGEFTLPNLKDFDPTKHIARSDVSKVVGANGVTVTKFHLPSTKSSPHNGEDTQWAPQSDLTDPEAALNNHFRVNPAPDNAHLFAWRRPKTGLRPLTKREFINRLSDIAKKHDLPNLKGHGLRIGGTLLYLKRGVPFDVVKTMGRWKGDSFTLYLRQHAMILAPYLQDSPALEPFTRYTMPPMR
ncbi:hypothetical protein PAXINDRAFT_19632 [Paxillus involutus ATCC 200175]|uniref:Tyr recombinase domain-containing protein n=1 Tax=Paxillus involutus ATCC 200175 TaxID=664439 RepID=A0A0C9TGT4_PAXIN|nr:hypothetical protein PAXINDRAFT_19632 [Paxillus involutus ATCC 200175]